MISARVISSRYNMSFKKFHETISFLTIVIGWISSDISFMTLTHYVTFQVISGELYIIHAIKYEYKSGSHYYICPISSGKIFLVCLILNIYMSRMNSIRVLRIILLQAFAKSSVIINFSSSVWYWKLNILYTKDPYFAIALLITANRKFENAHKGKQHSNLVTLKHTFLCTNKFVLDEI